ncbi:MULTISPECIES: aspartate/glutamate racemase family protein [Brevibacillus]|uniref:Racemase n=1 Tax=Brevibacillus parabrevis TaxID=54914 RepID=A0A4Y3PRS3_BREPA|nr:MULTISPECIES: aspartate/glutamate racemase family protein [Brevibacillus]RNB93361.1 aspartate/glutamate racemase family protein [Brevibacillus parabrevis]UED67865.1 aspartate/glutamate racemase family protein [Brevibacillus sp. HD3.3A]GEB34656.1 racemase [Brevibacillus parabrevis]
MKKIGLIGGMSWESSHVYYRLINEAVKERLGGLHSAKSIMYSVDFAEIADMQSDGRWDEAGEQMAEAARSLEAAGADLIVLCTNTMHKLASYIEDATKLPFLHIADAAGKAITVQGIKRVALLATRFTMEESFYTDRLRELHGIEVLIPDEQERKIVHDVIYQELCRGIIREESKSEYMKIINRLISEGAEGVILGCTEVGLLISANDCEVPVFDTSLIHAQAAVEAALLKAGE